MITARAVAIAALTVCRWILWALALLMAVYLGLAWWWGDPTFKIAYLGGAGLAALAGAFACGRLARRIAPDRR